MNKFEINDLVRGVAGAPYGVTNEHMREGLVAKVINDETILVRVRLHDTSAFEGSEHEVRSKHFEKIGHLKAFDRPAVLELAAAKKWREMLEFDLCGADLRNVNFDGASLDGASLDGASLDGASLNGARLDGASLDGASLDGASLDGARLNRARLNRASLDGASLDGASLDRASLDGASLDGASLDRASLDRARLNRASLDGASLDGASLDGARLENLSSASLDTLKRWFPGACPEKGAFTAFKKAYNKSISDSVIVELLIPETAKRGSAFGRKCRCSEAQVVSITSIDGKTEYKTARSSHNSDFIYTVGQTVSVEDFDENRWKECSTGIHFFITRGEAKRY